MKKQYAYILILVLLHIQCGLHNEVIYTVTGPVSANKIGFTLPHEHVLVDFIGADSVNANRYNADSVFMKLLPFLVELKNANCNTFFDCTPQYLGRDVKLLRRLSNASGVNIVTNTGYYGAVNQKYYPKQVYTERPEQIAKRWVSEFRNGIDGTGIKPGFIKLGADKGPLTADQKMILIAAALTHDQTGLTIAAHSGDGAAAREELSILMQNGVAPDAFVWVHAQNEKDSAVINELADIGAWVEFDGLNEDNVGEYVNMLSYLKRNELLHRTLVSQDAGWYNVGSPDSVVFRRYTTVFTDLIPALKKEGFSDSEIELVFRENPAAAFSVKKK